MKEGFRQCMAWLHTWTGLTVGWVLFFVFVTGTVGYFYAEVDRWMRPELPLSAATSSTARQLEVAEIFLKQRAGNAIEWNINFGGSERTRPDLSLFWRDPPKAGDEGARRGRGGRFNRATLDRNTGAEIKPDEVRNTGGGFLLYRMHYSLHYIPYEVAYRLIGVCTMFMLIAIVSGIVTHKKIFKDFFTFRPGKGQRSWLDAHNIVSVMALPFFLMITYSGLVFFLFQYMPAGVLAAYGTEQQKFTNELYGRDGEERRGRADMLPLQIFVDEAEARWGSGQIANMQVRNRGGENASVSVRRVDLHNIAGADSLRFDGVSGALVGEGRGRAAEDSSPAKVTYSALTSLHEGHFAGIWLRWGYFASGVLGCAMIGTGLVLWTVKRRQKQDKRLQTGQRVEFGFRLVECLNIGTIVGLPAAIAIYFWANRILPADFDARADWEVHAMFITWGLAIVYPALRAPQRAWIDLLCFAAAAFALVPLINALTTSRHLGVTLPAGDWVLAGFDLTMFAMAALFAVAARKMRRRLDPTLMSQPRRARAAAVAVAPVREATT